ncbi:MAG: protein kinase [Candidatus Aminicenantes bacterium]|nr:protein kinase [Candidatus Aminicenantes bacterium]
MKCPNCSTENSSDSAFCKKCGTNLFSTDQADFSHTMTAQAPAFELHKGSTFAGRYRVLEEVGSGGMGKVYKVLDETIDEEIALKLIRPVIASDKKTITRFKNELKLSRRISHDNVCRMYHLGEHEGMPYITMEFVSGQDLKSILKKVGKLSPQSTIETIDQVCSGLASAHKLGVVHRDLKPQNIMIDDDGIPHIMDFGIARSISTETITDSGMMIGTLDYMSPEQASGRKVDHRSDIYSLGVVIFEMLTGELPFKGETPIDTALKHQMETVPDPRTINPQIPEGLKHVIFKCLEKDRERRYQSIDELRRDLEKIDKGTPVTIKKVRKSTVPRMAFFAVPVLILALAAGAYFLFKKGPTEDVSANKPAALVQETEKQPAKKPSETPPAAPKKEETTAAQKPEPSMKKVPPSAVLPGSLEITSSPSGAEILVDGRSMGTTPFKGEFPSGRHQIVLKKPPEYRNYSAVLNVRSEDTTSRNFSLLPRYALKITSDPEGADVWIDGSLGGKTPFETELSKPDCRIKIEKGVSWRPVEESLTLTPGDNPFQYTLNPLYYRLNIRTEPNQARVSLGNDVLGDSPVYKENVAPGSYVIKIEKEGYKTLEETVDIQSDFSRMFRLERTEVSGTEVVSLTGKIRIKVQPFADVFIDGVLIGEVPPAIVRDVKTGRHTAEFVSTSLNKKYSVEFEIGPGENKEIRMNMRTGKSEVVVLK